MHPIRIFTLFALALLPAACATITPADPARLSAAPPSEPLPPDAWPVRADIPDPLPEPPANSDYTLRRFECAGPGALYELLDADSYALSTDGALSAVPPPVRTLLYLSQPPTNTTSGSPEPATVRFSFGSAASPNRLTIASSGNQTLVPVLFPAAEPRGLCLLLTSIAFVSEPESLLARTLAQRGWLVALITPPASAYKLDGLVVIENSDDDDDGAASTLAAIVDQHLAERAYAASAVVSQLFHEDPALDHKPLVLIGASLGALTLPAVAARLDHAPAAAVFIGGGMDLPRILLTTELGRARLSIMTLHPTGDANFQLSRPTDALRKRTAARALQLSRLDPAHLAPRLAGLPVLQIYAAHDEIIPANLGDDLYESLAHPERWSYPVGHTVLFFILGNTTSAIADWIAHATVPLVPSSP